MTTSFSLYLDLVRFLAALAVLVTHLNDGAVVGVPVSWWTQAYGSCAVVVFFVLSGYVISHVVEQREKTAIEYFGSRISRLYSVLLVALLVTAASDGMGAAIAPEFYKAHNFIAKPGWVGYLATLTFVNEFQIFHWGGIVAGSNSPLWSLSFEAAFYLAAGIVLFWKSRLRWLALILLLACAGRTIIALAPLWLLGFCLHKFRRHLEISPRDAAPAFALSLLTFLAWSADGKVLGLTTATMVWLPWDAWQFNRNLLADYLCAFSFAVNLVCARSLLHLGGAERFARFAKPIRWLASLTFPLYCLHKPLLYFLSAVSPFPLVSWLQPVFVAASVFLVVVLTTPVCDRLKSWMRDALGRRRIPATAQPERPAG
jgi:peptidoglycan/LPS O-acetylase OafA/YrhL